MEVDKVVVVRRSWLQLAGPPWRAAVSMRDVLRAAPPQCNHQTTHITNHEAIRFLGPTSRAI
jgi:hypothetical protein